MEAINNIQNERIIFSPLNWGLGHVSRSIQLLKKLQEQNNEIIIACDDKQQEIYEEYLEGVEFIPWKGYPFKFSGKGNFGLDIIQSFKKLISFGKKEIEFLKKLIEEKKITTVISDHRYFFRSEEARSVFVTHQVNLSLPWYLTLAKGVHNKLILSFDEVWIVDTKTHTFSKKLSASFKKKKAPVVHYIGPLSRFEKDESVAKFWTTVLVSGPEPYAEQFYKSQKGKFEEVPKNYCIIYNGFCEDISGKQKISWLEIDERLQETKKLIARSGYSTIMDAYFLECETEWHPTPGQWEQEYLASIH